MTPEQLELSRMFLNHINPKRDISCVVDRVIKKDKYDVAVVIPCYNVENYVEKAIRSVLEQDTTRNIQIIAVDDGSTDSTGNILDGYGDNENVIIVHQENRGLSGARNTGLMYVDAKYIFFLDSDDYILPDCLERLIEIAEEKHADIVGGGILRFDLDDDEPDYSGFTGKIQELSSETAEGFMWGKIFRSELFDNVAFPESYWFEDGIYAYLIAPRFKKSCILDYPAYMYRRNYNGISATSQGKPKSIDAYWLREIFLLDMEKLGIECDQHMYEMHLSEMALTYVRTNDLDINVKTAIFYLTMEWIKPLHERFTSTNKFHSVLEKGIELENFQTYCDGCAIIWNNKLNGGE
jgi:glycosyltransferase involved in cell wall biosynthesis